MIESPRTTIGAASGTLGLLMALVTSPVAGQATDGPLIHGFGAVFDVPGLELATPTELTYQVVFDVSDAPDDPAGLSTELNTVARFLNMHARAGVPRSQLQVAVVLHGGAARHTLDAVAFREQFGVESANGRLLDALAEAGVELYLCGQSAMSRGIATDRLRPGVTLALSAMTARAVLQDRGYREVN